MTYLTDCHTAFQGEDAISAHACSYLHNYSPIKNDPLFSSQFADQIRRFPVFTADHVSELTTFLDQRIHSGDSGAVSAAVEQSKYSPSKKLLDHVAKLIKGKPEYVLLDEQLVVYDKVVEAANAGVKGKKKVAIIVRGGTGNEQDHVALRFWCRFSSQLMRGGTGAYGFTEAEDAESCS
jgi:hypothetical protein